MKPLAIGDPVEVRVMVTSGYSPLNTKDFKAREAWVPATVSALDAMQLGVTFSDGKRLAIPLHHTNNFRRPLVTTLQTKWGTFTLDHIREIKTAYDAAVEAGETEFQYQGGAWQVGFVKYLLEFAEMEGMQL